MPVRPNMQPLIDFLRQQGQAALTDVFYDVTYWTDQQLQDILDQHKTVSTYPLLVKDTGNVKWGIQIPRHVYPDPDTIKIFNTSGSEVTPSYTYDTWTKVLTLASESTDLEYVEGDFIHMYYALADLWGQKAQQRFQYVDSRAGQNVLHLQQEYQHCLDREQFYRNKIIKRFRR